MAKELEQQGKLDDWARKVSKKAEAEWVQNVENGMQSLEAESEARKNNLILPDEEDEPNLGEQNPSSPDPASLVTTTPSRRKTKSG
jgi:hypothetical protein